MTSFYTAEAQEHAQQLMDNTLKYYSKRSLFMEQAPSFNFELNADQLLAKALKVGFIKKVGEDKYELNEDYSGGKA
tara:strand:+ start:500 stop:727 length:228 start_codon:yes stop_codon:yes gene_type:complete